MQCLEVVVLWTFCDRELLTLLGALDDATTHKPLQFLSESKSSSSATPASVV